MRSGSSRAYLCKLASRRGGAGGGKLRSVPCRAGNSGRGGAEGAAPGRAESRGGSSHSPTPADGEERVVWGRGSPYPTEGYVPLCVPPPTLTPTQRSAGQTAAQPSAPLPAQSHGTGSAVQHG